MERAMAQSNPSIFILLIILLPLITVLTFWAWMFREMIHDDNLPPGSKDYWTLMFLFLNVFAAMLYYVNEYKKRH